MTRTVSHAPFSLLLNPAHPMVMDSYNTARLKMNRQWSLVVTEVPFWCQLVVAPLLVNPLERVKVLLQTSRKQQLKGTGNHEFTVQSILVLRLLNIHILLFVSFYLYIPVAVPIWFWCIFKEFFYIDSCSFLYALRLSVSVPVLTDLI